MKPKQIVLLAVVAVFIVILLQNLDPVSIEILFWSVFAPKLILILASIFLGIIIGWFTRLAFRRGKASKAKVKPVEREQLKDRSKNSQIEPESRARSESESKA